jgi:enolase
VRAGVEIYQALRNLLLGEGLRTEVGDEAGFAPKLRSSEMAFQFLTRAAETAGYAPGVDVFFGIDSAASEFFEAEEERYRVDGAALAASDLAQLYMTWRERYPLIYFEDPFAEDDWAAWQSFTAAAGTHAEIVGDDLYATSARRIRLGISRKAANAVLIKPNQVGTLTETLQAVDVAQQAGQAVIISHRSGETEDTFIADLAVAVGASQIKAGAPARSERTAKYNRLLQIEAEASLGLCDSVYTVAKHYQRMYGEVAKLQV